MIEITRQKIDLDRIYASVEDHETGGVCIFIGRARKYANGREVTQMEYEGYDKMAESELVKIASEAKERWPVKKIALVHRLGNLALGEASVVIAVACAHRAQAFEACRFAIDTLKKRLPVWKKEFGTDGHWWVEGIKPEPENNLLFEEETNS